MKKVKSTKKVKGKVAQAIDAALEEIVTEISAVHVWDNGGETVDRYTVVVRAENGFDVYGMSSNPLAPNGFNQYSDTLYAFNASPRWGVKVDVKKLPRDVRKAIDQRLAA